MTAADIHLAFQSAKEKVSRASGDEHAKPAPKSDDPWSEQLHCTERGEVRDVIFNGALILRTDDWFAGNIRYNLFLDTVEARSLPWRNGGWQPWSDADDLQLASWCQERHAYLRPKTCADAVQIVARDVQHHPVRERLNALTWDGTFRLESWLTTYMGVVNSAYSRAVGKAWLVSAVARIMNTGVKADHILILEGAQGIGKSTAAGALAMDDAWFADEIADLGSKDAAQDLRGKWLIELGELSALRRGEVERVKAFVSRRVDHYRPSYGRRSEDHARQCVFLGSTNSDAYLQDQTGNRRFWPVRCGIVDVDRLRRDVAQIWAEATSAYRAGAQWWLDKNVEDEARSEQDDRRIADVWEDRILEWCVGKLKVTVPQILDIAIGMEVERQDPTSMSRVARVLTAAGWKHKRPRAKDGTRSRFYEAPVAAGPNEQADGPTENTTGPTADDAKESSKSAGGPTGPGGPTGFSTHMCAPPQQFRGPGGHSRTSRTTQAGGTVSNCVTCRSVRRLDDNRQCETCALAIDAGHVARLEDDMLRAGS